MERSAHGWHRPAACCRLATGVARARAGGAQGWQEDGCPSVAHTSLRPSGRDQTRQLGCVKRKKKKDAWDRVGSARLGRTSRATRRLSRAPDAPPRRGSAPLALAKVGWRGFQRSWVTPQQDPNISEGAEFPRLPRDPGAELLSGAQLFARFWDARARVCPVQPRPRRLQSAARWDRMGWPEGLGRAPGVVRAKDGAARSRTRAHTYTHTCTHSSRL